MRCSGSVCHREADCKMAKACLYKSSARLMYEQEVSDRVEERRRDLYVVDMTEDLDTPMEAKELFRDVYEGMMTPAYTEPVADFTGSVDGKGVKGVMKEMKCPLELMPPQALEGVAEVLKHGAVKYAANNWMRGMSWETVMGGILRHCSAFRRGEEIDPESGLPHLDHAACGIMFLRTYAHGPSSHLHEQFDDRLHIDQVVS